MVIAKYEEDFKRQISELVHNKIKTRAEIYRKYKIDPSTIVGWEKKYFGELENKENFKEKDIEIIKLKRILKKKGSGDSKWWATIT